MTQSVVCIQESAKIFELSKLFLEKKVSGVPVCDALGNLIGMVSDSDLAGLKKGIYVRDMMSRKVISVSAESSIEDVAAVLHQYGINRVPVLERGVLVGIISRTDLIGALAKRIAHSLEAV